MFNVSKNLHIGYGNVQHIYGMGEQEIVNEDQEDLKVRISELSKRSN